MTTETHAGMVVSVLVARVNMPALCNEAAKQFVSDLEQQRVSAHRGPSRRARQRFFKNVYNLFFQIILLSKITLFS